MDRFGVSVKGVLEVDGKYLLRINQYSSIVLICFVVSHYQPGF